MKSAVDLAFFDFSRRLLLHGPISKISWGEFRKKEEKVDGGLCLNY
jgi:hypothetical protein